MNAPIGATVTPIDTSLEWAKLFAAALGGGLVVKLLDIVYLETRRRQDKRQTVTAFVDQHLDPLLKSADELVGKFTSLAKEDFKTFAEVDPDDPYQHPDFGGAAYLIARFWTQIEILRQQALYVSISQDERGRWLQEFLDCMESRGVRLLDRVTQRSVGESLISASGTNSVKYIEFVRSTEKPETERWLRPLSNLLLRTRHTTERQQLLKYLVVVHAMIDQLDRSHSVTRERPGVAGKLSTQTWRDLNYRVFKTYLKQVADPQKYIGRPRVGAAAKRQGKAPR